MLLSDRDILRGKQLHLLNISPWSNANLQPASYDLTLSKSVKYPRYPGFIDAELLEEGCSISPGRFVLGSTAEKVVLSEFVGARLEGKSSLGRVGLQVHVTAGFIDPGFDGFLTLELVNLGPYPVPLTPGMKIAQIAFFELKSPCVNKYGFCRNHYTNQNEPIPVERRE